MMRTVACLLLGFGAFVPAALWGAAEGDDQDDSDLILRVEDPRPVKVVKITKDDFILVEGRGKGAANIQIPSYKVADVLRVDRPPDYNTGLDRLKDERYAVAARYFMDVLRSKDQKDKPWIKEYCNYRLAEAMYEGRYWDGYQGRTHKYSPPADYYSEVLKINPRSRFLLDANVKKPICLIEQKKFSEAEKAFVEAAAAIKQYREETARTADGEYRRLADRADAMLKLGNGLLNEKKDKFTEAAEIYGGVQRLTVGKFPTVYADAVDGELRCLVRLNKFGEAKARADQLIKKYQETYDPTLVAMLPGAYRVMGVASLAMAMEYEKNNSLPQAQGAYADARWNYLQVLVEYFDREDYVPEASYFVGLCYDKLKGQEPGGNELAIRYWLNVRRNYPDAEFAKKAAVELDRVGYKEPEKKEPEKKVAEKKEPDKKEPDKNEPDKKAPVKKGPTKK